MNWETFLGTIKLQAISICMFAVICLNSFVLYLVNAAFQAPKISEWIVVFVCLLCM